MRMIMKKITAILAITALGVSSAAFAQDKVTPVTVDRANMENLWLSNTNNAAGGIIDAPVRQTVAEAKYDLTKGDFKYAQLGDDNKTAIFHTKGGGIYENLGGAYFWGELTYTHESISGARWNATLVDPLRDMPFFLADDNYSKWKNQKYNIKFKAATPLLWDHLILGVAGNYDNAIAAKQIDPRPKTLMSKVEIFPSLVWKFRGGFSLGADFQYFSYREDGSGSRVNSLVDPKAWDMVAPGFFNAGVLANFGSSIHALRAYNANALGGGAQLGYERDKFRAVIGFNYTYKVEDVQFSYEKPQMAGTVRDNRYDITLSAEKKFESGNLLFLNFKTSSKDYDGIEYFQTYDNTYEVQTWITDAKFVRSNFKNTLETLKVDYMVTDGADGYVWKFGVEGNLCNDAYVYYVPESHRKIGYFDAGAHMTRNFAINSNNSVVANVSGGYSHAFTAELDYNGTRSEDPGYTEFTLLDFQYATTDFANFGADVKYVFSGLKGSSSLFAGASYKHLFPSGDKFKKRSFLVFSFGLTF